MINEEAFPECERNSLDDMYASDTAEEDYGHLFASATTQTMRTGIAILGEGLRIGELRR